MVLIMEGFNNWVRYEKNKIRSFGNSKRILLNSDIEIIKIPNLRSIIIIWITDFWTDFQFHLCWIELEIFSFMKNALTYITDVFLLRAGNFARGVRWIAAVERDKIQNRIKSRRTETETISEVKLAVFESLFVIINNKARRHLIFLVV